MKKFWSILVVPALMLALSDPAHAAKKKKKKVKDQTATSQTLEDKELADLTKKSEKIEKAEATDKVESPDGKANVEDTSIYTHAYREKLDAANRAKVEAQEQSAKDRARDVQYMKTLDRIDSMDRKAGAGK